MGWTIYDKIAVHEARLSSTQILIPSFRFMQDVGFYPFLGPRACCTKPGCNRRDEISEIYWNCCLYGSGHKILETTLHEWLVIAEKDRKNFVCQAFSPTFPDMGTNLPDSALASQRCSVTCGALSAFECQILVKKNIGILNFHITCPVKSDSTRFQLTKKCCLYCSLQTTNNKFFQFRTRLPEPPHLTGASCHHFAFVGFLALGQQQPCLPTVPGFGDGIGSMVQL